MLTDVTAGEKKLIDLLVKVKYKQRDTYFLIHVEAQSYTQKDFVKRMFIYFAKLYEKYDLPIYPIVIFSFDQPKIPQPKIYRLTFPNLNVLRFEFAAIQLNRLSWKKYLKHQNPVAAALMSKMNIPVKQRPKVKAECLRLLTTLQLDPARMQLISGFVDVYLDLNATEEQAFNAEISRMGLVTEEAYMEIVTSWQRQGQQEGQLQGRLQTREEIAINSLREGFAVETVARITGLTIEQVRQLQVQLQSEN